MSTAEQLPADENAYSYECSDARGVLQILCRNVDLVGSFHFNFYKPYFSEHADDIVSFGAVKNTVIAVRYDDSLHPTDPQAYRTHQYDVLSKHIRSWDVKKTNMFTGSGDRLEQTLLLTNAEDSKQTAALTLRSGKGNEWTESNESNLVVCSRYLSYIAIRQMRLTEAELGQKMAASEHIVRSIGRSALAP